MKRISYVEYLKETYLSTVIQINAERAPKNTVRREFLILKTAAMKNVLSPISVAIIIMVEELNPFQKSLDKNEGVDDKKEPPEEEVGVSACWNRW